MQVSIFGTSFAHSGRSESTAVVSRNIDTITPGYLCLHALRLALAILMQGQLKQYAIERMKISVGSLHPGRR